jgi:hypothetical protein
MQILCKVMQRCTFLPREEDRDADGEQREQSEVKKAKENIAS